MNNIEIIPIGIVVNHRDAAVDDRWASVESSIHLVDELPVSCLDAINGTPVIDIKPVYRQFLPLDDRIRQPGWVDLIMEDYWK
jgi:hypothetical protein